MFPHRFQFYQLLNTPVPATITRFHMTTQTTLSAAAPAPQEEPRLQWHRHSCLCAVAKPRTQLIEAAASLRFKFLIANLELEFHLSHRKLNPLEIPNRKFLTIFESLLTAVRSSPASSSPITHHSLLITDPSLSNPRYRD